MDTNTMGARQLNAQSSNIMRNWSYCSWRNALLGVVDDVRRKRNVDGRLRCCAAVVDYVVHMPLLLLAMISMAGGGAAPMC